MLAAATSSSRRAIQARPMPRVAQPEVHEQGHEDDREDRPVVRSQVRGAVELPEHGQVELVDRRDRLAAVGERVVADLDLVAVLGEAADDLAEGQRDDGDVVAAQAQGG